MVKLENVSKSYNNVKVLEKINFCFDKQGIYLLKGESGCGKTTLLNIISSRIEVDEGSVSVEEELFYLSFNDYLVEELRVKECIELHKDLFENFKDYKNRFNIDELINKRISKLSVGEKQRVGIFLALSSNCPVILLDEPFAGVDRVMKKEIIKELKKVSKNRLIIIASHQLIKDSSIKVIKLEKGRITSESVNREINNKISVRKLKNPFKWAIVLHKKQIISRIIFLLTITSLLFAQISINRQLEDINEEFNNSFSSKDIYYKENKTKLNRENFYSHIVSKLAYDLKDYFYNVYSSDMYNAKISVANQYLISKDIFSNINRMSGLREDEIVLELDYREYCLNNGYSYCYKSEIINDLKGKYLIYDVNNRSLKYKISEVIFGDTNRIYASNLEEMIEEVIGVYNDYYLDYYLIVYKDKLDDFYYSINSIASLLNYNFDLILEDEEYAYFIVRESENSYFSIEELDGVIACSEIGYSCNSFNFSTLTSLTYIDQENVKDKVKYQKYSRELNYEEIAISSSLSTLLNKKQGEYINLRFYFDESFYLLENVKVIEVIDNDNYYLYHDKYDYDLFEDKFNKVLRVSYVDGDNDKYLKTKPLDYFVIEETKEYLSGLFKFVTVFIYFILIVSFLILFIVEVNKIRKHLSIFKVVNINFSDSDKLIRDYLLIYLFFSIFLIIDSVLFMGYLFMFIFFYKISKRKIKSRISWI